MTYMDFNLNHYFKVKLTQMGFEHWRNRMNESMPEDKKESINYFLLKKDADGFVEFQAWHFMELFGETIHMGSQPLFETNIKVQLKD